MATSAMPGRRFSSSTMLIEAKLERYSVSRWLPGEIIDTTSRMSNERFCTITPFLRTSSGRRGSAICTRLLTLNTDWSTLVPGSKVAVTCSVPFDEEVELKNDSFSTPESCSSIGAATVRDSVSALAPGYEVVISTVGGAISGYCATASSFAATRPAMTMMMAITPANTGRWMKKLDTRVRPSTSARLLGGDRRARPQAHHVIEDHLLAGLQAVEHDPVLAHPAAGADRALHRFAFSVGDPDEAPPFVLQHRGLRHDDRLLRARDHPHAHELPREQRELRVRHFGAHLHRAGRSIDGRAGEIDARRLRIRPAVGHLEADLERLRIVAAQRGEFRLGERETHPERIAPRQRGEHRALIGRRNQAADRLLRPPGDAAHRRAHRCIGKV